MTRDEYGAAYERGFPEMITFLVRKGIPYDAAQETAQTAWVKGWERLDQLRDPLKLIPWMKITAINIYRESLRKGEPEGIDDPSCLRGNEYPIVNHIAAQEILDLCKEKHRKILMMFHIEGYTIKEIAKPQSWSEPRVRLKLLRARRHALKKAQEPKTSPV